MLINDMTINVKEQVQKPYEIDQLTRTTERNIAHSRLDRILVGPAIMS